jgi:hypothetical protein
MNPKILDIPTGYGDSWYTQTGVQQPRGLTRIFGLPILVKDSPFL